MNLLKIPFLVDKLKSHVISQNVLHHIGDLENIKCLHYNGCGMNWNDLMDKAALMGHLEVVKWLHENRTEGCTEDAMNWAARDGHLEVVKWLRENRFPNQLAL